MNDVIKIIGAKQHNLKNVSLEIPRNRLVVVTGLSGSGKSSLAFDTIYAEGQRRYVESLSSYARQFLGLMEKPDVELIDGLSPSISIEQRNPARNPRSTVGTVTEIYDYLRLLFARTGTRVCPTCGKVLEAWSVQGMGEDIAKRFEGKTVYVLAPIIQGRKGTYEEVFAKLKKQGFIKVMADGNIYDLGEEIKLARYKQHNIEVVVDEIFVSQEDKPRLRESLETAVKLSKGVAVVADAGNQKNIISYSENSACTKCSVSFQALEPRLFSFNTPYGACTQCSGLGVKMEITEDLVIENPAATIAEGAISAWSSPVTTKTNRWKGSWSNYYMDILRDVCKNMKIPTNVPWNKLPQKQRDILLYGGGTYRNMWTGNETDFEGVINNLKRRTSETESEFVREAIHARFMRETVCPSCHGARLKPEALSVFVGKKNIAQLSDMSVADAIEFFNKLKQTEKDAFISRQILKEIKARLGFLSSVGLNYLTLSRKAQTLSGGESQRIHLATQIGSGLTGVLYVLDEPTIGLHPSDNQKLLETLKALRDGGNTLIVVEHDAETILAADNLIDLGPASGEHGGEILAQGTVKEVLKNPKSVTAPYLNGTKEVFPLREPRKGSGKSLTIRGAQQYNLKNIDVEFELGKFICVTGVSGSGKSTLIHEILYKALAKKFYFAKDEPGKHAAIDGIDNINKVIIIDQSPIGKTPRSNPATYTGVFGPIRELFAKLPEAKRRDYKAGRFSFNVKGGRCEKCEGDGIIKIQMQFLPDVYVTCEECNGKRFNEDTLEVKYKGYSISDILDMSVEAALEHLGAIPNVKSVLQTLKDVGLGYIKLGQSATTLSGGEAQRVKLASELKRKATGRTLYILDEPTTGLHFADIGKLLSVLHRLVDNGNTIIVIEHNLDVIKTADQIIDLGPDGGSGGGYVMANGTPREVAKCKKSKTAGFLRKIFK